MPLFKCAQRNCQLTLPFGAAGVCPVLGHGLTPFDAPGVVTHFHTGCVVERQKNEFESSAFRLERFMPGTQRGLFDLSMSGGGGLISMTVRVHATFTMPPKRDWGPLLSKAYAELGPWTGTEKTTWKTEQQDALNTVWNATHHRIRLAHPGGWQRTYPVEMRVTFVESKSEAHIVADIEKAPPIDPLNFNCGGSRLDLAQIVTGNPQAVSKAAMSSQSGKPVAMESSLLGHQIEGVTVQYNIFAHEYGHMIGLPDEYNSGGAIGGKDIKADAYAIHCKGTDALALRAGEAWHWNERTDSLMSTGNVVHARHLITAWEAVTVATSKLTMPAWWSIT
jgi:hypothetical protein